MANSTPLPVNDEDVEEVEGLLRDLKNKAAEANDKGNVVMLSLYADLLKLVSPQVQKLRARVDREEMARVNKAHKEMRKAKRESAGSAA
jgi:hypothetical protein